MTAEETDDMVRRLLQIQRELWAIRSLLGTDPAEPLLAAVARVVAERDAAHARTEVLLEVVQTLQADKNKLLNGAACPLDLIHEYGEARYQLALSRRPVFDADSYRANLARAEAAWAALERYFSTPASGGEPVPPQPPPEPEWHTGQLPMGPEEHGEWLWIEPPGWAYGGVYKFVEGVNGAWTNRASTSWLAGSRGEFRWRRATNEEIAAAEARRG